MLTLSTYNKTHPLMMSRFMKWNHDFFGSSYEPTFHFKTFSFWKQYFSSLNTPAGPELDLGAGSGTELCWYKSPLCHLSVWMNSLNNFTIFSLRYYKHIKWQTTSYHKTPLNTEFFVWNYIFVKWQQELFKRSVTILVSWSFFIHSVS